MDRKTNGNPNIKCSVSSCAYHTPATGGLCTLQGLSVGCTQAASKIPPPTGGYISGGESMPYYLYILRCGDNSLYTGITTDVARRLAAHQSGKGAKYTRGRGPLTLVYQEELPDKPSALRRELAVKALTREEKLVLIQRGSA